ncbi:MAG: hypothetical protein NZ534_08940, partial [Bacteroidia bacterium]|nr:hypothetical protein [Bacteroidia bacterium]
MALAQVASVRAAPRKRNIGVVGDAKKSRPVGLRFEKPPRRWQKNERRGGGRKNATTTQTVSAGKFDRFVRQRSVL